MTVVNHIVLSTTYVRTKYTAFATCLAMMCRFSVCFGLQIFTAARNASKRSAPTDEALGRVLTGPLCDYLLVGEDRQAIFYPESETPFCFHVSPDSSLIPVVSKRSRPVKEAQDVFLGELLAAACPVAEDRYAFGTWGPF